MINRPAGRPRYRRRPIVRVQTCSPDDDCGRHPSCGPPGAVSHVLFKRRARSSAVRLGNRNYTGGGRLNASRSPSFGNTREFIAFNFIRFLNIFPPAPLHPPPPGSLSRTTRISFATVKLTVRFKVIFRHFHPS